MCTVLPKTKKYFTKALRTSPVSEKSAKNKKYIETNLYSQKQKKYITTALRTSPVREKQKVYLNKFVCVQYYQKSILPKTKKYITTALRTSPVRVKP